jgi:hypothetical protein
MEEHRFPLELDSNLRREYSLKIERNCAEREAVAAKQGFFKIVWRLIFAVTLLATFALVQIFRGPETAWWVWGICFLFILVCNTLSYQFFFAWRDRWESRKRLENWDSVIDDYNKTIRE